MLGGCVCVHVHVHTCTHAHMHMRHGIGGCVTCRLWWGLCGDRVRHVEAATVWRRLQPHACERGEVWRERGEVWRERGCGRVSREWGCAGAARCGVSGAAGSAMQGEIRGPHSHLDLVLHHRLTALEAREEDLALARLEAVDRGRDRAHVVRVGEVDELLGRGLGLGLGLGCSVLCGRVPSRGLGRGLGLGG